MKREWWLLAGSALSSFGIVAFLGKNATPDVRLAVWLGMVGPLAAALCSNIATERAYRKQPESVMRVMITAFGLKIVFFGGYIALVVKAGWVQSVPFAMSFTGYFLALHIIEAFHLRRLLATT
jgi:hypothetical protein